MKTTLLNISGKLDPGTVEIYCAVSTIASQLGMLFVVVGASARDLVMHHGYGANIERATQDVDFGIQVADWDAFNNLKTQLLGAGFTLGRVEHRMLSPSKTPIDIIPFGGNQDATAHIAWPPTGEVVMSVLGFQEACDHAQLVRIQEEPPMDIPVASPQGMVLLKLMAWMDRTEDLRQKDAKDILYLLKAYAAIPDVSDKVYDNLMDTYGWDLEMAGAHQLGADAGEIASNQTRAAIENLLNEAQQRPRTERLVEEMCEQPEHQFKKYRDYLNAFANGFTG